MTESHVYIIVVNWNNASDTIHCLHSLLCLEYKAFTILLIDNASTDDSLLKVSAWLKSPNHTEEDVRDCWANQYPSFKPRLEPIPFITLDDTMLSSTYDLTGISVVLIKSHLNRGFAGGNNLGLKFGMQQENAGFFWLINNDAIVHSEALTALMTSASRFPRIGILGSTILEYDHPRHIQYAGGALYLPLFGLSLPSLAGRAYRKEELYATPELDYIFGASFFFRRRVAQRVGLLEDSYFLYGEELDYALRAKRYFGLGYAKDSLVWHKGGASTSQNPNSFRTRAYYDARSRILIARRFFQWSILFVSLYLVTLILYFLLQGKTEHAKSIVRGYLDGVRMALSDSITTTQRV